MTTKQDPPSQDQVLGYFETLSNWGRWGADDERGTLNHIDADARKRGARAVRHGVSVSCGWEIGTGPGGIERTTVAFPFASQRPGNDAIPSLGSEDERWGSSGESLAFRFHGYAHTHVDSPCHIFWDGRIYNGRPADLVRADAGATWCAVTAAADGMVTRGVLLDIPAVRGVPRLLPGDAVYPEDLEAAEQRQGVNIEPGDAVLLRTGFGRHRHEAGDAALEQAHLPHAGWHASCLPWLHEREVAYIGADMANDTMPSGYPKVFMPIHAIGLVAMGLWLVDNCDLEACAATAEHLRQWDFNLSACPIRMTGTTGSPLNPIATF